jgi:hypothetical protein
MLQLSLRRWFALRDEYAAEYTQYLLDNPLPDVFKYKPEHQSSDNILAELAQVSAHRAGFVEYLGRTE